MYPPIKEWWFSIAVLVFFWGGGNYSHIYIYIHYSQWWISPQRTFHLPTMTAGMIYLHVGYFFPGPFLVKPIKISTSQFSVNFAELLSPCLCQVFLKLSNLRWQAPQQSTNTKKRWKPQDWGGWARPFQPKWFCLNDSTLVDLASNFRVLNHHQSIRSFVLGPGHLSSYRGFACLSSFLFTVYS